MEKKKMNYRSKHIQLIFNPNSGSSNESSDQLLTVMKELQYWKFIPEPYVMEPDCELSDVIQEAIAKGIKMVVVCGGDGTVSSAARILTGTGVTLGIIPTGTQNNIAYSLGISTDIPTAISFLRTGLHQNIDVGLCTCDGVTTPFIELCSAGLFSTLFSSADEIQHGNFTRIGDFLATLTSTEPSDIHLVLDDNRDFTCTGHVALIANMPYIVRHYQVGAPLSYRDGYLDILFFADQTKLNLIGYMLKGTGTNLEDDTGILHFRVRKITIETNPAMNILTDGKQLGSGSAVIEVQRHALSVMTRPIHEKSGDLDEKN